MGSALAFPAAENKNKVRLVGTHLDREIIKNCKEKYRHPKFEKNFPGGVSFYQIEELSEALDGADAVILGVSSFGVEWFKETILPRLAENTVLLSVTKGLLNGEDGTLVSYPEILGDGGKKNK